MKRMMQKYEKEKKEKREKKINEQKERLLRDNFAILFSLSENEA